MCKRNWSSEIKSIATEIDQIQIYNTKSLFKIGVARQKLMEININLWRNAVISNAKTLLYREIKTSYNVEYYVHRTHNRRNRSLIARLRAGCLDLEIERGRWRGVTRDNRICNLCFNGIEDELHFLFYCDKLNFVRAQFTDFMSCLNVCQNDFEKFDMLFSKACLIQSTKLIRMLYDNRKCLLYSKK